MVSMHLDFLALMEKTIQADRKKKLLITNEKGRKQAIDGGYTGKITNVNTSIIKSLLNAGYTPVISPIAISDEFDFINVDDEKIKIGSGFSLKIAGKHLIKL